MRCMLGTLNVLLGPLIGTSSTLALEAFVYFYDSYNLFTKLFRAIRQTDIGHSQLMGHEAIVGCTIVPMIV